jgi:hypothetical protein
VRGDLPYHQGHALLLSAYWLRAHPVSPTGQRIPYLNGIGSSHILGEVSMPFIDRDSFEAILEHGDTRTEVLVKVTEQVDVTIKRRHREGYVWIDGSSLRIKGGDRAVLAFSNGGREIIRITSISMDVGVDGSAMIVSFLNDESWKGEVD